MPESMASEPAEPTTRQDELIEKAFTVADGHQPDGRNHYGYDQCDCGWVAEGGTERWADHLVHLLAVEGLLADPAQTTELEELRGRVEELTDFAGEQANARRESDRVRNIAAREAADLRDERDTARTQLAEKTEYAGEKAREGDVMSLEIDELTAERDRLSLLLRGMARKLVAYRKWTLGDDVPAVHRLRRELAEATEINQDWQRYKRRKIAERRQMEAELAEAREGGKKVLALAEKFQSERDERQARIDVLERWLRPEVVVGWIQPRGYRERYLAEDVIRGLLAGDPIASDQTCAALLGDQPPTPADKTWCPRCQKDATEDRYTQESASLWRCLDCHAVLQVPDPPLSGVALRAVEEADDAAEPACECFVVPEEQWTRHYDATEPGSMVEQNPDCPVHPAQQTDAAGDLP